MSWRGDGTTLRGKLPTDRHVSLERDKMANRIEVGRGEGGISPRRERSDGKKIKAQPECVIVSEFGY
jgi:hypothetical protein